MSFELRSETCTDTVPTVYCIQSIVDQKAILHYGDIL